MRLRGLGVNRIATSSRAPSGSHGDVSLLSPVVGKITSRLNRPAAVYLCAMTMQRWTKRTPPTTMMISRAYLCRRATHCIHPVSATACVQAQHAITQTVGRGLCHATVRLAPVRLFVSCTFSHAMTPQSTTKRGAERLRDEERQGDREVYRDTPPDRKRERREERKRARAWTTVCARACLGLAVRLLSALQYSPLLTLLDTTTTVMEATEEDQVFTDEAVHVPSYSEFWKQYVACSGPFVMG